MYRQRFQFIQSIKDYFLNLGFTQVDVPPLVQNPGMETHIIPFKIGDKYLHTSPEFFLKEILANSDLKKIFSLGYVFRDEPHSPEHREQFLMLEWYRVGESIDKIVEDVNKLLNVVYKKEIKLEVLSVQEIFQKYLNLDILNFLSIEKIENLFHDRFKELIPSDTSTLLWEDYFFLLFLNYIEPYLQDHPFLILNNYPSQLAALSKVSTTDSRVCERFELYINGSEIANCFQECTDKLVLEERFREQARLKKSLYGIDLPWPERFLNSMNHYPESAGIALGVERLLKSCLKQENCFLD